MKRHIFRPFDDSLDHGSDTGWFPVNDFDHEKIPTKGEDIVVTSIPSPFAQIDLYKNAFKDVALGKGMGGLGVRRLVSYALDVGEVFFLSNRGKVKNLISI